MERIDRSRVDDDIPLRSAGIEQIIEEDLTQEQRMHCYCCSQLVFAQTLGQSLGMVQTKHYFAQLI